MMQQPNICVVNKRDGASGIYIGRGNSRTPGSPLGNPFKMKTEADRNKVVEQFQEWLDNEMKIPESPARREIERIAALAKTAKHPIHLVCWCAPKRCHGDVVKRTIEDVLCHETTQSTGPNAGFNPKIEPRSLEDASGKNTPPPSRSQRNKPANSKMVQIPNVDQGGDQPNEAETDKKRIRKIQKLLRQIQQLKERDPNTLDNDQTHKLT